MLLIAQLHDLVNDAHLEAHLGLKDGQAQQDLSTIRDWVAYKEGQSREYIGTPWEKEFLSREEAIQQNLQTGNTEEAE